MLISYSYELIGLGNSCAVRTTNPSVKHMIAYSIIRYRVRHIEELEAAWNCRSGVYSISALYEVHMLCLCQHCQGVTVTV
jgi:hypothetical protein